MAAVALLSTVIIGTFGFFGMREMHDRAEATYETAIEPLIELGAMNGALGKIVADILLSMQHDPVSRSHDLHKDHPITAHIDSMTEWRKNFETHWAAFMKTKLDAEEQKFANTIDANYKAFITNTYEPVVAQLRAGNFSIGLTELLVTGFQTNAEPVEKTITLLIEKEGRIALDEFNEAKAAYDSARNWMLVVIVLGIGLTVTVAFLIASSITGPLARIQAMSSDIEQSGDFRKRIETSAGDEVGKTARIINSLLTSLQAAFTRLLKNTEQLDVASVELAQLSGRVAKASEKTSDSSSDMAASVEEMTASITQVGENAKETSKNAQSVMELSQSGATIVNKTVVEMQHMSQAVQNSSETIAELGKQSEQISGIVQTIKDVADQTNLLALNAAIEAARAGEQGRGFAVVADEIRKLAERTTSATTEIAAMISAIQESAHTAVSSMTHAAAMVSEGVSLAEQAGAAINDIAHGASQARDRVADITAALGEQSSASHQIAEQVERVAQATDENSEAAKSSSAAADNIAKLSAAMRETMSKFTV
jgi:methyl-accepting chemotaxis protein